MSCRLVFASEFNKHKCQKQLIIVKMYIWMFFLIYRKKSPDDGQHLEVETLKGTVQLIGCTFNHMGQIPWWILMFLATSVFLWQADFILFISFDEAMAFDS